MRTRWSSRASMAASIRPSAQPALAQVQLDAWLGRLERPLSELKDDYRSGKLPLLRVPEATDDIAACAGRDWRASARARRRIVFFGTGGSSLGGQALAQLAGWNIPGGADAAQRKRPRTRFYDNLDAMTLERALASFDLCAHALRGGVQVRRNARDDGASGVSALQAVIGAGLGAADPAPVPGRDRAGAGPARANALRSLFESYGIPAARSSHRHRRALFRPHQRRPAAGAGARARRACPAAAAPRRSSMRCWPPSTPATSRPLSARQRLSGSTRDRGIRVMVMMPYADRLGKLSEWYVQLWAESLGKDGQGTAPMPCLGPLDQHSQLQLFMDGPKEHCITVVRVAYRRHRAAARSGAVRKGRPRLHGRARRGRSRGGTGAGRARGAAARRPPRAHLRPRPA